MGIVVNDDNILGAEKHFELYFRTTTSSDVQLITQTVPDSVTVIIEDDEGNYSQCLLFFLMKKVAMSRSIPIIAKFSLILIHNYFTYAP